MAEHRLPALHAVTDDAVIARADFPSLARAVLAAGGPDVALHLRGPHAGGRFLFELAAPLARAAAEAEALFVVNDRVDVALAVEAGGVQLARRSLLPADARSMLGDGPLVGVSVGATAEVWDAADGGADFVLAGSVYPTATHPGREGIGLRELGEMTRLGVPTVAIGGITPERVAEVRDAGARGVAAIRAVWDADDPARAVARFLEAWKDADAHD